MPTPWLLPPLPSLLPTTLIHHHPCRPCPLCCCPQHLLHAHVVCCHLPSWLCGCRHSLASHHLPSMLMLLVDCCFYLSHGWGGLGPSFAPPIQQTCPCPMSPGCGVTTTAEAIPALADGQFLPSSLPGACMTGAMRWKGGREGMPLLDAISIALVMFGSVMFVMRGRVSVEST